MKQITLRKATLDSREVARMVEKEHRFLMRDIRNYIGEMKQLEKTGECKIAQSSFFIESTYTDNQNKKQPCYQVTRKGCEFIANKLTGKKGTLFTARFINRFHEMEEYIESIERMRADPEWQEARRINKEFRLKETKEIQAFVEYARLNGSQNADIYYIKFSQMVNEAVRIRSGERNNLTIEMLQVITVIELAVRFAAAEEMAKGTEYHKIFRICKSRAHGIAENAYLPVVKRLQEALPEEGEQDD